MNIIGHGGTGKSTLLKAIITSLAQRNASYLLAKTAMSGIATSLIGGPLFIGGLAFQQESNQAEKIGWIVQAKISKNAGQKYYNTLAGLGRIWHAHERFTLPPVSSSQFSENGKWMH